MHDESEDNVLDSEPLPVMEFEEVEIEDVDEKAKEADDYEFEFPLFASAPPKDSNDETRGRTTEPVMKVSLRERSEERIKNDRPTSYYFAVYTEEEKRRFEQAAITTEILFKHEVIVDHQPWKCINLTEYNAKIKPKKHTRAGKKKRQAKIEGRKRREERNLVKKKLEEEAQARLLKKKLHKRGGKKHKKKEEKPKQEKQMPRFRTE